MPVLITGRNYGEEGNHRGGNRLAHIIEEEERDGKPSR
jgi:hypothetical protein